jgi:hypothetical protein
MASMESTVLFDDESLSELKSLSVEELLVKCIGIIDGHDIPATYPKDYLELKLSIEANSLNELYIYCGELYRRNIICVNKEYKKHHTAYQTEIIEMDSFIYLYNKLFHNECCICKKVTDKCYIMNKNGGHSNRKITMTPIKKIFGYDFEDLICFNCKSKKEERTNHEGFTFNYLVVKNKYNKIFHHELYGIEEQYVTVSLFTEADMQSRMGMIYYRMVNSIPWLYLQLENKLQEIQMVKETMLRIMKTPLLTKELEECMDEILDLNGNRISQLKEYLTEDQYRFVRSGAKFEELEDQQDMLNRMNKMLKQLKMTSIGETLLDLPIARPITPEIKHLENELLANKKRQKEHETQLKKLLGK